MRFVGSLKFELELELELVAKTMKLTPSVTHADVVAVERVGY